MPVGEIASLRYCADIVLCIEATHNMAPMLEKVKEKVLSLCQRFTDEMEIHSKNIMQFRVKIIVFRDFGVDSEPMVESRFYVLNEERDDFYGFLNSIKASDCENKCANSLEALALAMKSEWVKTGSARRHTIILFTNSSVRKLGEGKDVPRYPSSMPADLSELREWWEGQEMEKRAKRLIVFAPDMEPWSDMVDWSNAFQTITYTDDDIQACAEMICHAW